jgi:hypothetical protein
MGELTGSGTMTRLRSFTLRHHGMHRRSRCSICGTRLCAEDAIGCVGAELVHAECALVHLFMSSPGGAGRECVSAALSAEATECWQAVLSDLVAVQQLNVGATEHR